MLTFKSTKDINKLNTLNSAFPIMKDLITSTIEAYQPYYPELYGYLVLIEESDIDSVIALPEVQSKLIDINWEGAYMRDGFYFAYFLRSDQLGMGFLIPDAPWLSGKLRDILDALVTS